jgi:hypothetical protein
LLCRFFDVEQILDEHETCCLTGLLLRIMYEAADSSIPDTEEKSGFGLGLYLSDTLNLDLIGSILITMHSAADSSMKLWERSRDLNLVASSRADAEHVSHWKT